MLLPTAVPINEARKSIRSSIRFTPGVRDDATIGPIFNEQVEDWPVHLALLKSFWASVLLGAGTFRGNPLEKHMMLPLEPEHFQVWLRLFRETAREVLRPEGAEHWFFAGRSGLPRRFRPRWRNPADRTRKRRDQRP